jgi:hypothetical protein
MAEWIRKSLRDHTDDVTILKNPNKGWYIHYIDNGYINPKYRNTIEPGDYLEDFPAMSHLYLRMDWSDLEPEEGSFRWDIVDGIMDEWGPKGYRFSFRICCSETHADMPYATPRWVEEAGCPGRMCVVRGGSGFKVFEPDYGHPVFLEKLENFLSAFAAKYDGDKRVAYIDIGSYGNWGEGHNGFTSGEMWPVEVVRKHIDLHSRIFKKTLIIANYSLGFSYHDMEIAFANMKYGAAQGMGSRTDSVMVKSYLHYGYSTVQEKELFDLFWRNAPIDLELEHYSSVRKLQPEDYRLCLPMYEAMKEIHASFCGFHGDPRLWLRENPVLTDYLSNRMGYWLFIPWIERLSQWRAGGRAAFDIGISNRGVAPTYWPASAAVRIKRGDGRSHEQQANLDPKRWIPGEHKERILIDVPDDYTGTCELQIRLRDETLDCPILLAMKENRRDDGGWHTIDEIEVNAK